MELNYLTQKYTGFSFYIRRLAKAASKIVGFILSTSNGNGGDSSMCIVAKEEKKEGGGEIIGHH